MPNSDDPPDPPVDRSRDYLTPGRMLHLLAAAIRGGGPAAVLATCDAVEFGHISVVEALEKLHRMARLS